MWIMMNDCFLSIVQKDCGPDELLVRARRPGDIEKVFGRGTIVTRATDADYLYRAAVPLVNVAEAMTREVARVNYDNFKDSVGDPDLHSAYTRVWTAMAATQDPRPYSTPYRHEPQPRAAMAAVQQHKRTTQKPKKLHVGSKKGGKR